MSLGRSSNLRCVAPRCAANDAGVYGTSESRMWTVFRIDGSHTVLTMLRTAVSYVVLKNTCFRSSTTRTGVVFKLGPVFGSHNIFKLMAQA